MAYLFPGLAKGNDDSLCKQSGGMLRCNMVGPECNISAAIMLQPTPLQGSAFDLRGINIIDINMLYDK
jgi:hypothetical protein